MTLFLSITSILPSSRIRREESVSSTIPRIFSAEMRCCLSKIIMKRCEVYAHTRTQLMAHYWISIFFPKGSFVRSFVSSSRAHHCNLFNNKKGFYHRLKRCVTQEYWEKCQTGHYVCVCVCCEWRYTLHVIWTIKNCVRRATCNWPRNIIWTTPKTRFYNTFTDDDGKKNTAIHFSCKVMI